MRSFGIVVANHKSFANLRRTVFAPSTSVVKDGIVVYIFAVILIHGCFPVFFFVCILTAKTQCVSVKSFHQRQLKIKAELPFIFINTLIAVCKLVQFPTFIIQSRDSNSRIRCTTTNTTESINKVFTCIVVHFQTEITFVWPVLAGT